MALSLYGQAVSWLEHRSAGFGNERGLLPLILELYPQLYVTVHLSLLSLVLEVASQCSLGLGLLTYLNLMLLQRAGTQLERGGKDLAHFFPRDVWGP